MVDVVTALGRWSAGTGPLYGQLTDALRGAIQRGELPAGSRLPAERALALKISVGRGTVLAAYDQLKLEGWVESRQGSGSWVTRRRPDGLNTPAQIMHSVAGNALFRGLIEGEGSSIDFSVASPDGTGIVTEERMAAVSEDLIKLNHLAGYSVAGLPELRSAIAEHLTKTGLRTSAEEVILTNGAQQAINLVAAFCLQPGDTVLVENPTFVGAIDVFRAASAHVIAIPHESTGISSARLRDIARRSSPRLTYLTPSYHNPTGWLMPAEQRETIARMSADLRLPILEDGTMADTPITREPPPPIASYASKAPIFTVGSMSKLFWGGLRLGWVRAPVWAVAGLIRLKAIADIGSSLPSEVLAMHLLRNVDEIKRWRRKQLAERLYAASSAMEQLLPDWTWACPEGGLTLWAKLPTGDATDFVQLAHRRDVNFVAGPCLTVDDSHHEYLRMAYVLPPDVLRTGIERLAAAWRDYLDKREPAELLTAG